MNFDISFSDELEDEQEFESDSGNNKINISVSKQTQETIKNNSITENIESFIKNKIERKIKNIKNTFSKKEDESPETNFALNKEKKSSVKSNEKIMAVLEND